MADCSRQMIIMTPLTMVMALYQAHIGFNKLLWIDRATKRKLALVLYRRQIILTFKGTQTFWQQRPGASELNDKWLPNFRPKSLHTTAITFELASYGPNSARANSFGFGQPSVYIITMWPKSGDRVRTYIFWIMQGNAFHLVRELFLVLRLSAYLKITA